MDPVLLEQLATLNRLNLSPDLIRELIEHDKWKIKEQHRHEKELALLGTKKPSSSAAYVSCDSEDEVFNADTSGGVCESNHIGLVAKTRVMAGAAQKAKDLKPDTDLPTSLLALVIAISWCGQRLNRWPQASDSKAALNFRNDLDKAVEKYGVKDVLGSVDFVARVLSDWTPDLVSEQLDTLRSDYEHKRSISISSSPLFAEFSKNFSHISPEMFESCYNQHNEQFVPAAIYLLRREFKNHPPSDLSHIEGWKQGWQQYLPTYLKQWQEDLRKMESRMRIAQRAWKESIS